MVFDPNSGWVDPAILEDYAERGLLRVARHPELPLSVWNYTDQVQYDRLWDEVTLACRGLVTNAAGVIVSRAFDKFFNVEEHEAGYMPPLPWDRLFEVQEKVDGSLIVCTDDPEYGRVISSRGSFASEHVGWAKPILETVPQFPGLTHMYELIHPENRIVVDYGDAVMLRLLAVRDPQTGEWVEEEEEYEQMGSGIASDVVLRKSYGFMGTDDDLPPIPDDQEGYVLVWSCGRRAKIKGEEYVRLHRLLTGVSSRTIWELLATGQSLDPVVERVPDEFHAWVRQTVDDLCVAYDMTVSIAKQLYDIGMGAVEDFDLDGPDADPRERKKVFANAVLGWEYGSKTAQGVAFSMYDGKPYDQAIWKAIKPERTLPFRSEV